MNSSDIRVVRLGRADFDDVVETLSSAFHGYPVMRYILKDAGDNFDGHLRELVGWFTINRLLRDWPVLGAMRDGRMLGAANINPPRPAPWPEELKERHRRFKDAIGEAAMARFQAFADACEPLEPKEPHYYLGMIGVRPENHGEGVGRLLLEAVSEMSARDPDSTGVVLTTETPLNLQLYKHFGYEVLGRANAEELETWTLFRPDPT